MQFRCGAKVIRRMFHERESGVIGDSEQISYSQLAAISSTSSFDSSRPAIRR
jgi:hypothetical protein